MPDQDTAPPADSATESDRTTESPSTEPSAPDPGDPGGMGGPRAGGTPHDRPPGGSSPAETPDDEKKHPR